jgi:hypothetical protein
LIHHHDQPPGRGRVQQRLARRQVQRLLVPFQVAQQLAGAAASSSSGRSVGAKTSVGQSALPGRAPRPRAGSSPARTTDDLPLPDGPSTARKRVVLSFSTRCWTSESRPKK